MPIEQPMSSRSLIWAWAGVATMLCVPVALLLAFHTRFDYERDLADIPALWLAGGMVFSGVVFLALLPLIERSTCLSSGTAKRLFVFVLAFGLALRGAMFWTTPALEDDFHRYMWDGAVTANGFNPYARSPESAGEAGAPSRLAELAKQSGLIHKRVNHGNLRTVYPPVAQGAFALAYALKPWSMTAWRLVCLAGEAATLVLILLLLRAVGRSPLWVALYWWNPVVIKEMINTAHMEAVLMPFVLGALLAFVRGRHLLSVAMIGFGVGVKLWPIVLAPLVLRPLLSEPRKLLVAVGVLAGMCGLWAVLPILGGFDDTSGFVAYATRWRTNSALSAALAHFSSFFLQPLGLSVEVSNRLLRFFAALVLLGFVARQVISPVDGATDFIARACWIIIALLLLSPAQFPWYLVWVLVLMPLRPVLSMLVATALLPIYYMSFYYYGIGDYGVFKDQIVWGIWLPIWALLAWEFLGGRRNPSLPRIQKAEGADL